MQHWIQCHKTIGPYVLYTHNYVLWWLDMISHQELSLKLVRAGGHYHYLPTAKKVRLAAWTLPVK